MPWALQSHGGLRKPTYRSPSLNPADPLSNGIVAFWAMNEGGGSTLHSAPYGIEGVLPGGTAWWGYFLELKAGSAGDYIALPSSANANSPLRVQNHTIIAKVKLDTHSGSGSRMLIGSPDTIIGLGFYEWGIRGTTVPGDTGKLGFAYCGTDYGIHGWYLSSVSLISIPGGGNPWVTLGGTWQNITTTGFASFYKDGVFINTVNTTAYPIAYPAGTLAIGTQTNNSVWDGIFEYFCLWNRCLTDDEVRQFSLFPYGTPTVPRFV